MHAAFRGAALMVLFVSLVACGERTEKRSQPTVPTVSAVTRVDLVDVPVTLTVPGTVISDGRIDVSSRVVGFIRRLDVREGQRVSRGDLLVRIDPSDIDEAIHQARAGVRAGLKDMDDAEKDAALFARLASEGAVATETLRKANVRGDIARANLDKAQSVLAAAEAQKGYASIASPVDGVVVSVAMRSGEMAAAGATILTVESREVLLFKGFVPESRLAEIDPAEPVRVRIDTLKGTPFRGRVRGLVPSGDEITRRYEINIVLPDNPSLVPGMFGRADIVLGTRTVPVVPRSALIRRGGLDGVFVLDGETARFRWLRTGRILDDSVEVVAGLSGGERILMAANDTVRDGSLIEMTESGR